MKKIFTKALSVFLATLMFLTVAPAFTLAAEESATPVVPVFSIELAEETADQVAIKLKLKENSFKALDITVSACDDLVLTAITFNSDIFATGGAGSSNIDTGMISFARTESFVAEYEIATFTYSKTTAEGINADEFEVTVTSCAVEVDGADVDVSETVVVENNIPKAHVHEPDGTWVTTVPSTCSSKGTIVQYCKICGEVATSGELAMTDHKNTVDEHKDATCTEAGYDKVFCNDCKTYISEKEIAATGHKNTKVEHKDATCTAAGYDKIICNDCGETLESTTIDATGHKNTKTEHKDPTCTEAGYDKVICNDCGETLESTTIDATGHKNTKTEHKDPTCTEAGYDKVICNDCGKTLSSTPIAAKGHGDSETARLAPTCTEDGYIRKVCKDCKATLEETNLPSKGHTYITDTKLATCTEDGYNRLLCPACQDVKSSVTYKKTGHKWGKWTIVEAPTYSKDGVERRICDNCGSDEERSVNKLVAKPEEIVMSMQEIGMNFRGTTRLFANVYPEEAAYSTEIIWESSDESVATVDETGSVYAAGVGTATITAKTADGKLSATCEVTVKYTAIQWIIVYLLFGWIWYI